jgi:hypothetical protein
MELSVFAYGGWYNEQQDLQATLMDLTTSEILVDEKDLNNNQSYVLTVDPLHEYKLTFSGHFAAYDDSESFIFGYAAFDEPIHSIIPDGTSTAGLLFLALSPLCLLRKLYLNSI